MKPFCNYYRTLLIMMVFTMFYLNDAFGQTTDESGTCSPGANVTSGNCSFSVGYDSEVDASDAVAIGRESLATGANSIAIGGDQASASAQYSHVFGLSSASGDYSFAIGNESLTAGNNSFSFGMHLKTESTNDYNMVIGFGDNSSQQRLTNDISNSIMIGVNSTEPTMFIEDAGGGSALGRVGIGTTDPDGILHIMDENNTDTELIIEKADTKEGAILFDNAGTPSASITYNSGEQMILENAITNKEIRFRVSNGTLTEVMTIDGSDLSVGIGVSNPESKLHVNAEDAVSTTENIALFTVGGNTAERFVFTNSSTTNGAFAPVMSAVSRQTDSPALRIQAEVDNSNDTLTEPVMTFQVRNDATTFTNRPLFRWEEPNTVRMQMNAGGNLGIGTTSPTEILHIDGRGRSTQAAWETTSDQRLKENIEELEGARHILNALNPVTYNWVDTYFNAHSSLPVNNWGFIAQEVEQVMPEMVSTVAEENVGDSINPMVLTDLKLLNLSPLFPILVKGYQELDNAVVTQAQVIEGMQQQLDSLLTIVSACCQAVTPSFKMDGTEELDESQTDAVYLLFQNDPNPFQYSTQITYNVPSEIQDAEVMIVDVNGRVVKRIPITSRDVNDSLTVYSSDLNSGVYFYSLIGNGSVLETKKMVCSQ